MSRLGVAEDIAELAIGHVRADLIARYNKDEAWEGRRDTFTRVSDHVAALIGARAGAAVIPLTVDGRLSNGAGETRYTRRMVCAPCQPSGAQAGGR